MKFTGMVCVVLGLIMAFSATAVCCDRPCMSPLIACDEWKPHRIYKNYVALCIAEQADENDWDIGLCVTEMGKQPKKKYHHNRWKAGHLNDFSLEFTKATGEVTFSICDGENPPIVLSNIYPDYIGRGMEDLHIMACSSKSGLLSRWTSTQVRDILVNGEEPDGNVNVESSDKNYTYVTISGLGCDDFIITGKIRCYWLLKLYQKRIQVYFRFGEPCDPSVDIQGLPGDLNGDCVVNFGDFGIVSSNWLETGCGEPGWCQGGDYDLSTEVDLLDLSFLAENWLDKYYGGGCGTEESPYLIYTVEQLNAIGVNPNDWDAHFKVMATLDLAEYHTGNSFNTIGSPEIPFSGVFDGNDFEIINFSQGEQSEDIVGLFRVVDGPDAVIKNLWLINPTVEVAGDAEGTSICHYAGALVGKMLQGTIFRCHVETIDEEGEVAGYPGLAETIGANYIGGMIGFNAGTILESSAMIDVSGYDYGGGLCGWNEGTIEECFSAGVTVSGHDQIGGLVGQNASGGVILNSYSRKEVFSHDQTGGLVGQNDGVVEKCYATGHVMENSDNRGGLIGENENGTVIGCFWDIETCGELNNNEVGTPLFTAEMQAELTYTAAGWDFTTPVWSIYEAIDYPVFWWEVIPVPSPMLWEVEPYATGAYSIKMEASQAVSWDGGGVEYYFECTAGGGHDSGWQDSAEYEDTGLAEMSSYSYRVNVRDKTVNHNESGYSQEASATTQRDIIAPVPNPLMWASVPSMLNATTSTMTAMTAWDENGGIEYYFANVTDPNHDSGWQASPVYEDSGLTELSIYCYDVKARDLSDNLNETSYRGLASCVITGDATSPAPGPTWVSPPAATGPYSIVMTISTVTDASGVEYKFYNLTVSGHDSGWQDSTTYEDTGLELLTEYTYQVVARDKSPYHNETAPSPTASATTEDDVSAPDPDPMEWALFPSAAGPHSITMTAATASDGGGVEYYFECTVGGGNSSDWQASPVYVDTGLGLESQYTYRVKSRDKSHNYNETEWSDEVTGTTDRDTTAPTPDPMSWELVPSVVPGENTITMTATTAVDDEGGPVEYYFYNLTAPTHDSGWQSSREYTDTDLDTNLYTYQVKARDVHYSDLGEEWYYNETACSDEASDTTTPQTVVTETFYSVASDDGRIWDDGSGVWDFVEHPLSWYRGCEPVDATNFALRLGDYGKYGYRSVVSFDTSSLPEDSVVDTVKLILTRAGQADPLNNHPFAWGGSCLVDIRNPYFGTSVALENNVQTNDDWRTSGGDTAAVASFDISLGAASDPGENGVMESTSFNADGLSRINVSGTTQLRVYLTQRINDPDDVNADYVCFYSGEYEIAGYRPKLEVTYKTRSPMVTFNGIAGHDGRVYDTNGSGVGAGNNSVEATNYALRLGDYYSDGQNHSYRTVVSFDTSWLPDDCEIASARLQLTRGFYGPEKLPTPIEMDNPFDWGGSCKIDIAMGHLGTDVALENCDYEAVADATGIATFSEDPGREQPMVSSEFSAVGKNYISKTGITQLRVYLTLPTNNDSKSDYLGFYSGEYASQQELKVPKLIIRYVEQ